MLRKLKTWVPEKENKTSKSDTKTITSKKAKAAPIKERSQKTSKNRRESRIEEERIEWARDKRSRVSEATNFEILNNLDF